jgi:hypothetical protein
MVIVSEKNVYLFFILLASTSSTRRINSIVSEIIDRLTIDDLLSMLNVAFDRDSIFSLNQHCHTTSNVHSERFSLLTVEVRSLDFQSILHFDEVSPLLNVVDRSHVESW